MAFHEDRAAMERAMGASPEQIAELQKASRRATVTAEDHAAALAVVTSWLDQMEGQAAVTTADQLVLVGMIAATRADARAAARCPMGRDHAPMLNGRCALCGDRTTE